MKASSFLGFLPALLSMSQCVVAQMVASSSGSGGHGVYNIPPPEPLKMVPNPNMKMWLPDTYVQKLPSNPGVGRAIPFNTGFRMTLEQVLGHSVSLEPGKASMPFTAAFVNLAKHEVFGDPTRSWVEVPHQGENLLLTLANNPGWEESGASPILMVWRRMTDPRSQATSTTLFRIYHSSQEMFAELKKALQPFRISIIAGEARKFLD